VSERVGTPIPTPDRSLARPFRTGALTSLTVGRQNNTRHRAVDGTSAASVVSEHDVMSRRPVALGVSLAVHVGLVALVLGVTTEMSARAYPRTIQLNGRSQERLQGRDLMFEVLAGDGIPIRLTSAGGDAAVGLAWWTPSVGLWLATDRLPVNLSGRTLQVAMSVGDDIQHRIGTIEIDEDGSGRIVADWIVDRPAPGTPITLSVSEAGSSWWRRQPTTALAGTSAMRE